MLVRPYTRSLDAALELVPDDFDWIVCRANGGATIHAIVGTSDMDRAGFGATPALAMCEAALRCMEYEEEDSAI